MPIHNIQTMHMNEIPRKKDRSTVADAGTSIAQNQTAGSGVQQLEKLSAYLPELSACISRHDIYQFQELTSGVEKLLETLQLTDLLKQMQRLHAKCVTAQDLVLNEIEIQDLIQALRNNSRP